jgi:hypothetical protein
MLLSNKAPFIEKKIQMQCATRRIKNLVQCDASWADVNFRDLLPPLCDFGCLIRCEAVNAIREQVDTR